MKYYYLAGNQQQGPYSLEQIRTLVQPTTLVWREGMATWAEAYTLPELQRGAVPLPPKRTPAFFAAIAKCMVKYADFTGRANRTEYWFFVLGCIIATTLTGAVTFGYGAPLASIGLFVPQLAAGFRRVQDTGRNGWFFLIPIYGFILCFQTGTPGPNRFGPVPTL